MCNAYVPESTALVGMVVRNDRVRFCLLKNLVLMVSVSVEIMLTSGSIPHCLKKGKS